MQFVVILDACVLAVVKIYACHMCHKLHNSFFSLFFLFSFPLRLHTAIVFNLYFGTLLAVNAETQLL